MEMISNSLPFHFTHTNIIEKKLNDALNYIEDSRISSRLKELQSEALVYVYKMGVGYLHKGIKLNWVIRYLNRKQQYIFAAVNEMELKEIVGITVYSKRFYAPEEEIILISIASQLGRINKKTQTHFIELCRNYMVV